MRVICLALFAVLAPAVCGAQTSAPVQRVDVAAAAGWFTADRSPSSDCCGSGWSEGLFKGVTAGYYWTDHLKTEAGLASPGTTEGYSFSSKLLANNFLSYTSEQHHYDGAKVSLAQIYQFGRNTTFH